MKTSNMSFDAYSSPVYQYFMHFNGVASMLFGLLSMYLTIMKTPRSFGSYKFFLFNISFWAFMFDFYMTILYTPRLLFPALVMCPTGLLATHNNELGYFYFFMFLTFFGCSTIAVLAAFLYRYAALTGKLQLLLSTKVLIGLGILHLTYESPTIILYIFGMLDRPAIDKAILTQWPNIAPYYIGSGCSALHFDVTPFPYMFMSSCILAFGLGIPIVVTLVCKSFGTLKKQRALMSPKTYRMHHQLLVSLIFQLLVPITTLFGPFVIAASLVMSGAENVAWLNQATFILGTLHSSGNTLTMLYFIAPYRQATLKLFRINHVLRRGTISTIDNSRTFDYQSTTRNYSPNGASVFQH